MHDWIPFVPPARAACAAVVAATKTIIAIRKSRYRSVEKTPTGSGPEPNTARPASNEKTHTRETGPAQPILTTVSAIAQAAGAIMTILWWLHQAGVL